MCILSIDLTIGFDVDAFACSLTGEQPVEEVHMLHVVVFCTALYEVSATHGVQIIVGSRSTRRFLGARLDPARADFLKVGGLRRVSSERLSLSRWR